MKNGIEGLGINLIDNDSSKEDSPNIENFLPDEIKETEYKKTGNFITLPIPYVETFDESSDFFPGANLKSSKIKFLVAGINENTKRLEEAIVVFEQLKTADNTTFFTDQTPLKEWHTVLEEQKPSEALFKSDENGRTIISYGKNIISSNDTYKSKKDDISKLTFSNDDKPIRLETKIPQETYEKILKLNKKAA